MDFGKRVAITDVCLLVEDAERTVQFYTQKLGFTLRRRAEGFADFVSQGVTLACWELDHINRHCGVSNMRSPKGASKACVAVRLNAPSEIDEAYRELIAKGVNVLRPPEDHPWNARCIYFTDPDDNLWELYAWHADGPKHDFDLAEQHTKTN